MAASFECEFVENVPKSTQAKCPVCLLVLREPYQATCCGKNFCKECIHQIKAANQACPTCKKGDFSIFHNLGLQQSLYDFQVYCTHKSQGCEWTGELRELDNHLNSDPPADKALQGCPFTPIKCPLSCVGCEKGVCRKDIKSHINDKLISYMMIQSTRLREKDQQYLKLVTKVSELENEIEVLKIEQAKVMSGGPPDQPTSKWQPVAHATGTYKPRGAEFTMTDFEEYQKDNDVWISPHFYTHTNGYKMCLTVDANGSGPGRGTHLSVYVCLMKGEFDDQLKWPFRGTVTFKLMNQEEDSDHVIKTANSMEVPDCCSRVMTDERTDNAWGLVKYLSHADLQPKYLKNDCIKLCIKKVELY